MTIFTEAWRAIGAWRFPSPAACPHRWRACVHARPGRRHAIPARRGRPRFGKGRARGLPSTGAFPARTSVADPPLHSWDEIYAPNGFRQVCFSRLRLRRQGGGGIEKISGGVGGFTGCSIRHHEALVIALPNENGAKQTARSNLGSTPNNRRQNLCDLAKHCR